MVKIFYNVYKFIPIIFFLTFIVLKGQEKDLQISDRLPGFSKIEIDSASFFMESDKPIHAITIDHNGVIYVGGKLDVFTISPDKSLKIFVTLENPTANTIIWSMRFDKSGNLFIAAKDRIVKISPDRKQKVIIKEDFSGPCGVTDLRFDKQGNLYLVYDNIIARYDSAYNKSIFIDGSKFTTPIKWAVGIEFTDDEKEIFIGDCGGSKVYVVPITLADYYQKTKIYNSSFGQYFTKDNSANVYLTSIGGNNDIPELLMFEHNGIRNDIFCKSKPIQDENNYKKTIAFGATGFENEAIYCIIGNKIYSYHLKLPDR